MATFRPPSGAPSALVHRGYRTRRILLMTFQRDLAWQYLDLTYRASIAHQLARYALTLNYSLLPDEVVHQAKRCVLDALGCAIGAYEAPGRPIFEDTVKELGGTPEATV